MKKLAGLFKGLAGAGVLPLNLIPTIDVAQVEEDIQRLRGGRVRGDAEDAGGVDGGSVPVAGQAGKSHSAASCGVQREHRSPECHERAAILQGDPRRERK